jgi:hypothetical protein
MQPLLDQFADRLDGTATECRDQSATANRSAFRENGSSPSGWLRGVFWLISPLLRFLNNVLDMHRNNQAFVKLLDANASQGRFFRAIPEDELWQNCNHAYQYLV